MEELQSFGSPIKIIKKALSSVFIMAMIAGGFLVNWGYLLFYLFTSFSSTTWLWLIVGVLLFGVVFPVVYLSLAYSYGQGVLIWELYKEGARPLIAKLFSGVLDQFLVENPNDKTTIDESKIVKEVEERQKHFLEKMPDFVRAYFQLFFTSKDILKIVQEQRQSGAEKEAVKQKSMQSFFEALDLQMSELLEPSLYPFYIVGAVNLVVFWLM